MAELAAASQLLQGHSQGGRAHPDAVQESTHSVTGPGSAASIHRCPGPQRSCTGMLDHLKVDVYGERMPLKACGTVLVRDPQLLAVTVFDPSVCVVTGGDCEVGCDDAHACAGWWVGDELQHASTVDRATAGGITMRGENSRGG